MAGIYDGRKIIDLATISPVLTELLSTINYHESRNKKSNFWFEFQYGNKQACKVFRNSHLRWYHTLQVKFDLLV